ncbi:MAG: hypothetical protein CK424_00970 [Legionella sp.]|nr:MAG: hypothetical protein CK424_00970 [Legionella sp.]
MTETEQIELLKKWWKRYHNIVIVTLSIILLAASGAKYWHWHRQTVSEQASNAYEHLMVAFSNQDFKSARSYTNQLMTQYPGTVYADTAQLIQAKLDVTSGHYAKARVVLHKVATHSKFKVLVDIARLRLARVLAYEKSYDTALHELAQITDANYEALRAELRGDIYYAMGKLEQAQSDYQTAKKDMEKSGIINPFLDMKQHELLAAIHSSVSKNQVHARS